MKYDITQVSNYIQLLYPYRILKQPSEFLPAPLRQVSPEVLTFSEGVATDDVDSYNRPIYAFTAVTSGTGVPLLEFELGDADTFLSDCIAVEVDSSKIILTAATDALPDDILIYCHWCASFAAIQQALTEFRENLQQLASDIDKLTRQLNAVDYSGLLSVDEGVPEHLIRFPASGEGIEDAECKIVSGGESTSTIEYPSNEQLTHLAKQLDGVIHLNLRANTTYSLSQHTGGELVLSGGGSVYLYNIQSAIRFENFIGSASIMQCSNVTIDRNTVLTSCPCVGSIITMIGGFLQDLTLYRHSCFIHKSGNVKNFKHIGTFCIYRSEITGSDVSIRLPKSISRSAVQGLYISPGGDIIKNGKEISFVTGHHDDPFVPSSTSYAGDSSVIPDGGKGTEPYPEVEGGINIPTAYENLSTRAYKDIIFPQEFMLTGTGPQAVADINTNTFHALRACMNWCCGEFGPSIYGASYGKLIRTWIMYEPDSAYRGTGKTLEDFILRLRSKILSWGGHDVWERSYRDLKNATWMTDDYALKFMQDLYNNIRYPQLFGVTADSDLDVLKAMSGMPTMNETTGLGTPTIPSRNQPVVWSVVKRAVLNEFSGYEGYYVLYRPRAYDTYLNKGVNPAVGG